MSSQTHQDRLAVALGNQGLGKWEPAAAMVRLVRELVGMLEDGEEILPRQIEDADNVLYTFLDTLPKKVQEDVREG